MSVEVSRCTDRAADRRGSWRADADADSDSDPAAPVQRGARKGRLKQGVTAGVFARSGLMSRPVPRGCEAWHRRFDLRGPADWPILKKYGLCPRCTRAARGTIPIGPSP